MMRTGVLFITRSSFMANSLNSRLARVLNELLLILLRPGAHAVEDGVDPLSVILSTRVSILPPNPQRLLRRAIGDREQNGFLRRMVRVALPRRHHEHVVDAP